MMRCKPLAMSMCIVCIMSVDGTEYTIGGWTPGDESTFLRLWGPIFEEYLTTAVGAMYEPPATFKLVAADFGEQQSFSKLFSEDQLDFVCTFFEVYSRLNHLK